MAERRHSWDERNLRCCKKLNVGDVDPAIHLCATVPDLTRLDWPPAQLGAVTSRIGSRRPGPVAALVSSWIRTSPLHGARAAGFEGPAQGTYAFLRRRAMRPAVPGLATEPATPSLISCLVQPGCCNRDQKPAAWSKGQGQRVPIVTTKRREKSSTERLRTLTSEAI
jgi:hypothetical protein